MKKLLIALLLISATGYAQKKFMPGVRAGLNFARFTQNDNPNEVFNYRTGFYVSFLPTINFNELYTLQPEVGYSSQGSIKKYLVTLQQGSNISQALRSEELERNYLVFAIVNKFKLNKFNFHLGPTLEIIFGDNAKTLNPDPLFNNDLSDDTPIDLGFTAGFGYNFTKNIGIETRIKKGIIPTQNSFESTNLVYQIGAYYNF